MTTAVKMPKNTRMVRGLKAVRMIEAPSFAQKCSRAKGSKRKGLVYQAQVAQFLEKTIPTKWVGIEGPWLEFVDDRGHQYAQPDWVGVNVKDGLICITEVKLNRVPEAWWQLNVLYLPLVQKLFPEFDIALLEIATTIRVFDTPTSVSLISNFEEIQPGVTKFMRVSYD